MMRYVVYDPLYELFSSYAEAEDVVFLSLKYAYKESGDVAGIDTVVVDNKGHVRDRGYLWRISIDGRLWRYKDVNPDFGFDLDDKGRVRIS